MATRILQNMFHFPVIYSVTLWNHDMQYLAKIEVRVQDENVMVEDTVVAVKKAWKISLVFQNIKNQLVKKHLG